MKTNKLFNKFCFFFAKEMDALKDKYVPTGIYYLCTLKLDELVECQFGLGSETFKVKCTNILSEDYLEQDAKEISHYLFWKLMSLYELTTNLVPTLDRLVDDEFI